MEATAALGIAAALAVIVVAVGFGGLRIVPAGHHGVVIRAGRVRRTRPPGPVLVLPGAEQLRLVPQHPCPIDPLAVNAVTLDGVEVRLVVSVLWRVVDPVPAAQAVPDPQTATEEVVERSLRRLAGSEDLADLLRHREAKLSRVPEATAPLLEPLGVEVVDVALLDAEVRIGAELLRLLR